MKKISYAIFILFTMMLPGLVYGDSINISCPSTATVGSTVTCTISLDVENKVYSLSTAVVVPSNFTIVGNKVNLASGEVDWQGGDTISDDGKIGIYSSIPAGPGNITVGTLNLNIGSGTSVGEKTIKLSDVAITYRSDDSEVKLADASATINVQADSTVIQSDLSSLRATDGSGTLMPSNDSHAYTLELPANVDEFGLVATTSDSSDVVVFLNATTNEPYTSVAHSGSVYTLSEVPFVTNGQASMLIKIIVNGDSTHPYVVTVVRPTSISNDQKGLSSLTIGGENIVLENDPNKAVEEYEVFLADVSSYKVEATLTDSANFKFSDTTVIPFVTNGEQEFLIEVVPKVSGVTGKTYIITVKKKSGSGNNTPATTTAATNTPTTNPRTGGGMAIVTFVVMIIALGVSYYVYKQTLSETN